MLDPIDFDKAVAYIARECKTSEEIAEFKEHLQASEEDWADICRAVNNDVESGFTFVAEWVDE